jgi:hypothetical protein
MIKAKFGEGSIGKWREGKVTNVQLAKHVKKEGADSWRVIYSVMDDEQKR